MNDTIIAALISGLCVAIPSIIATVATIRKDTAVQNVKIEHISNDLAALSERVSLHNHLQERVVVLENEVAHLQQNINN